jgi:hypothetical protein
MGGILQNMGEAAFNKLLNLGAERREADWYQTRKKFMEAEQQRQQEEHEFNYGRPAPVLGAMDDFTPQQPAVVGAKERQFNQEEFKIDAGVFSHVLEYAPKNAQAIYDKTLAKRYGTAKIESSGAGKWNARFADGSAFMWDQRTGEHRLIRGKGGGAGGGPSLSKMTDINSTEKSILAGWKPSADGYFPDSMATTPEEYLQEIANTLGHPRRDEALDALDELQQLHKMRGSKLGLKPRETEEQTSGRKERQRLLRERGVQFSQPGQGRLSNVGQPIGPATQKRIVRRGTDPDTGRPVIQYEDGTIEYADTNVRNY